MEEVNTSSSIIDIKNDISINTSYPIINNQKPSSTVESMKISYEIKTAKDILKKDFKHSDDYIVIFSITAIINSNSFKWNVYKTFSQIRDSFNLIRKELKHNNLLDPETKTICKQIKHFSQGEMISNLPSVTAAYSNLFFKDNTKNCIALKESLCISATSFSETNSGYKPFEGVGYKEAEPRCFRLTLKVFCNFLECLLYKQWNKRWLMLRNDMICYLNSSTTLIGKNVYWFDEEIDVSRPYDNNVLVIQNLARKLVVKFDSAFECALWYNEINHRIEVIKEQIMNNIYRSFTTQKDFCNAKFFIDGEDYFTTLFEQLLNAKESVFITDWWLSPEMFLRRPIKVDDYVDGHSKHNKQELSRFMDVVNYIAHRGVKVYILVYHEVSIALSLDSKHTKTTLNNLHANIRVTRHPKGATDLLWSHHEKLVIIDQHVAFVGGLDICWGRYDNHNHPIVDEYNEQHSYMFPGIDYSNARICDFSNVSDYLKESVNRREHCRMPWHDVHSMLEGPVVADVARHFVERWNHARFENRNLGIVEVRQAVEKSHKNDDIILSKTYKEHLITSKTIELKESKSPEINMNENSEEEIDTTHKKEMFSNDISNFNSLGDNYISNKDINLGTFPERSKEKKKTTKDSFKSATKEKYHKFISAIKNYTHKKAKSNKKLTTSVFLTDNKTVATNTRDFKCQVLRSCSFWSIGKNQTENSILQGYYKLIDNSKHYIYIENQFFISKAYTDEERNANPNYISTLVENEIALHIRTRIERAYETKTPFKVYIFIPLLPGFNGEIDNSPTVSVILKYTYQTLSHNNGLSLLELLYNKMGEAVNDYICVFSLRNHSTLNKIPVTELIYIHSKLMIIDDETVLIGSANINDRSMLGSRDSEFAVIIEQRKTLVSKIGGQECKVAPFASSFRRALMAEHMGINKDNKILDDPISEELLQLAKTTAKNNTLMYREIFDCYPDNKFDSYETVRKRRIPKTEEDYHELMMNYERNKENIIGHIVEFPMDFLKNQNLGIDILCKENLVPEKNFT